MNEVNQYSCLKYVYELLTDSSFDIDTVPSDLAFDPEFICIFEEIMSIRNLVDSLAKGDLKQNARGTGCIASSLKALQASMLQMKLKLKAAAYSDANEQPELFGEFSRALSIMAKQLNTYRSRLEYHCETDELTRIANRRKAFDFGRREFSKFKRSLQPMGVLAIDLDNFKDINNIYGHSYADTILINTAKTIRQSIRQNDFLGRIGEDEFMLIISNADKELSLAASERIKERIKTLETKMSDGSTVKLTASFGLTNAKPEDQAFEDVLRRADSALYQAKKIGQNTLVYL